MKMELEWLRPISLDDGSDQNLLYICDHRRLPVAAGLYVFGRRHGQKFEALYVGKAQSIQNRVRGQFNNLPLMMHIRNAKSGERILLVAVFNAKPGQQKDKCIDILERALIRHFLSEGHDLVNVHGATIRRHEITSYGASGAVPEIMFVDRGPGE